MGPGKRGSVPFDDGKVRTGPGKRSADEITRDMSPPRKRIEGPFFVESRRPGELSMGLRPTHMHENRFEPALGSNRRGTAKAELTLDLLRPLASLVWVARFGPICVAPSSPVWIGST